MNDTKKVQATYEYPVYLRGLAGNLILGEDNNPIVIHAVGDPVFAEDGETPIYKIVEYATLPPMDDDLIEILGRPCFQCIGLANALRLKGVDIPFKAEQEQAEVIHFTLSKYLQDKANWRQLCRDDLAGGFVQQNGRMAFANVGHIGKACSLITVTVMGQETETFKYEAFNIKGIFKKPYVLEDGIFFLDDSMAAQAVIKNLSAGEEFDTSKLPESWMDYNQFLAKLEEQHKV